MCVCVCVHRCRAFAKKYGFSATLPRREDREKRLVAQDADVIRYYADLPTSPPTKLGTFNKPGLVYNGKETSHSCSTTCQSALVTKRRVQVTTTRFSIAVFFFNYTVVSFSYVRQHV